MTSGRGSPQADETSTFDIFTIFTGRRINPPVTSLSSFRVCPSSTFTRETLHHIAPQGPHGSAKDTHGDCFFVYSRTGTCFSSSCPRKTVERSRQDWYGDLHRRIGDWLRLCRLPPDLRPFGCSLLDRLSIHPVGDRAAGGARFRVRERLPRHGERGSDGDLHPFARSPHRGGVVGHVEFHWRRALDRRCRLRHHLAAAG